MRYLSLPFVFLVACGRPDVAPTLEIRSPSAESEFDGYANLDVRVAVEDERNDPVEVEFFIDGELVGSAEGEKCKGGCQVNGLASTLDFADGEHLLTAAVTDSNGTRTELTDEEGVLFEIWDVPYVDTIAVHNSQEAGLNGPDIEVEVHVLDEESALYRGCAALEDIEEDDLPYEELGAPFVYNTEGAMLRFADIAFTPVRMVVIESDNGDHCPEWPEITDLLDDDVDEVYGVSQTVDLSLLFNDEEVTITNADFSGLVVKKGRPVNAD